MAARKKSTTRSAGKPKKAAARAAKPAKKAAKKPAAGAGKPGKKTAPAMSQEQMMALWQKAMTPAAGHRRLEPMAGTFVTRTTFTMAPGAPAQVSEGVSEHRWVLGGRYLEQHYKGGSMGMPFEGLGYTGFDNIQGKYVGTWMDSFGTGIMSSVGTGKPTDQRLDFASTCHEPSGKLVTFECIVRIADRDNHSYEMWTRDPAGKKFRTMLVEYTRK